MGPRLLAHGLSRAHRATLAFPTTHSRAQSAVMAAVSAIRQPKSESVATAAVSVVTQELEVFGGTVSYLTVPP